MKTIRVVSYNVHFGARPEKIVAEIKENKNLALADVLFFQEIEEHTGEQIGRAKKIAQGLGLHFFYAPAREVKNKGTHGIATLSKFKLETNYSLMLPRFNLRINTRPRIALISEIHIHKKPITLCNIHLDARLNSKDRVQQLDAALEKLMKIKHGKIILGGDLNTIPFRLAARLAPIFFENQLKKIHAHVVARGFKNFCELDGYTMRRGIFKMRLDHIYTSGLPIVKSGIEQAVKASDHKPLWADIRID